jgi:hypothetical protein
MAKPLSFSLSSHKHSFCVCVHFSILQFLCFLTWFLCLVPFPSIGCLLTILVFHVLKEILIAVSLVESVFVVYLYPQIEPKVLILDFILSYLLLTHIKWDGDLNDKLEGIWNEVVMTYFKTLFRHASRD